MTTNYCYIVKFYELNAKGKNVSNGEHIDNVYSTLEKAQGYLDFIRWCYAEAPEEAKREDAYFLGDTEIEGIHFSVPFLIIKHKNGKSTFYHIERSELKD